MRYTKLLRNSIKAKLFPLTVYDLRTSNIVPSELPYLPRKILRNDRFLLNIPISKCRTPIYSNLDSTRNPFVKTLLQYKEDDTLTYEKSALRQFYQTTTPKNTSEVFGIDNAALREFPSYQYLYPWMGESFQDILARRKAVSVKENRENGSINGSLEEIGHTDFGPVAEEKGQIELQRLKAIYNAISKAGYIEKPQHLDGGILGYFLIDDLNGDWCFMITSGKHRAYALSALEYKTIPVFIEVNFHILKRLSDIEFWPQVKNSIFTKDEARFIFRNVLRGAI